MVDSKWFEVEMAKGFRFGSTCLSQCQISVGICDNDIFSVHVYSKRDPYSEKPDFRGMSLVMTLDKGRIKM